MRRFAHARRGATAVEFALISIPLMVLMFGVLELGIILLVTATLETGTEFAARNIRTGVFQASVPITNPPQTEEVTKEQFHDLVCRNMSWLKTDCLSSENLIVETQTFSTFAQSNTAEPPDDMETFNEEDTCWSPGEATDIVLVRTYYRWPIITPLLDTILVNDGNGGRLVTSARIFRNEPFNTNTPTGAGC